MASASYLSDNSVNSGESKGQQCEAHWALAFKDGHWCLHCTDEAEKAFQTSKSLEGFNKVFNKVYLTNHHQFPKRHHLQGSGGTIKS